MSNSIYTGVFTSGQTLPAAQLNDVVYYLNNHDHGTEANGGVPAQFIPKILTTSAKNALSPISTGLCVWDSTLGTFSYYNGSSWNSLGTSGNSILYGNGNGGTSNVTIGAGLTFAGGSLAAVSAVGTPATINVGQTYGPTTTAVMVNATAICFSSNNSTPSGGLIAIGSTGSLSGPGGCEAVTQSSTTNIWVPMTVLVPKGWYYQISAFGYGSISGTSTSLGY